MLQLIKPQHTDFRLTEALLRLPGWTYLNFVMWSMSSKLVLCFLSLCLMVLRALALVGLIFFFRSLLARVSVKITNSMKSIGMCQGDVPWVIVQV